MNSRVLISIPVTIRQLKMILLSKQSSVKGSNSLYMLSIYFIPEGYKAHVHKLKPGEDFEDSGEMHDSWMEEERRHMKMFPEFRSWSKPAYPTRRTHSNPTRQTHTDSTLTHTSPTDKTHPTKTYDPPPRFEKAKTGENCTRHFLLIACGFLTKREDI